MPARQHEKKLLALLLAPVLIPFIFLCVCLTKTTVGTVLCPAVTTHRLTHQIKCFSMKLCNKTKPKLRNVMKHDLIEPITIKFVCEGHFNVIINEY